VPRDIATDLGVFDNYVTKETIKVSQKDTVVGYFQWGRQAEAEPRLVDDRFAGGGAAAGQRLLGLQGSALAVWSNRLFTDVKVNLFGYDFPLGVKADYKSARRARHRHQLHERRRVGTRSTWPGRSRR
jgi:hypothetical protein